ncbi:hypothetical protein [Arcobacter arenosus]|uniref:Type II/III secretion system secretin-like domain-containing protein n=1 Tax=Arcobacter arenosus TaxID=2576037 RepID=A0A5R8Y3F5_9BACT|nr:hypothetical protein [Arcobacter arenosus]TLP39609.1 hypothetical protein FDK22_07000 [Arcobacter arenosus]
MTNIFKYIILLMITLISLNAYDIDDKKIYQKDFENKTIYLPLNNYRTLIFDERIKGIQLTNSENIRAEFIDTDHSPLKMLKVLGKNISNESAIVELESGRTIQVNFSIMQNLDTIISIVKTTYPELIIEQANDTIILKGYVKDYREKDKVLDIFKKSGISLEEKLVDMIETSTPSKMIRIKLYVVEINNDDGIDLKNGWSLSSNNYQTYTVYDEVNDREYTRNFPLGSVPDAGVRDQYNDLLDTALQTYIAEAVSLTGGLTGAANYLGKYFNTSLVLNYLSSEGVANVLNESTLLTLENLSETDDGAAEFLAGGSIRLPVSTTTTTTTNSGYEEIEYGIKLKIKAKNVMRNNYIDLEITTSNTTLDWTNAVNDIPSFNKNEVKTNILTKDGSTIILGGQITNSNSFDSSKIPLLGDIPVLGKLFSSDSFKEGKSEVVFFLTPEIIDPAENNQFESFLKTKKRILDTSKYKDSVSWADEKYDNEKKEKEITETTKKVETKEEKVELTDEEKHRKRVNEILYRN